VGFYEHGDEQSSIKGENLLITSVTIRFSRRPLLGAGRTLDLSDIFSWKLITNELPDFSQAVPL
jgi:hypothetical protein